MQNDQTLREPARASIDAWPGFVVLLLVTFAFGPLLAGDFGFVNLDDATAIYQNPHFRGLSLTHLEWMFTTPHMGHYQPLTWLSLGLDFTLFGMDPAGYHRTNLLLHLANAYLVYVLFTLLLRRGSVGNPTAARVGMPLRWGAALGALFFAVHPLRVESVAWVTERRDVLSGFFYLLALIYYLRRDEKPASRGPYLLCLLFFALSMLAKAWGVTFAFVLLLLDAYPLGRFTAPGPQRRRIGRETVWEKLPFLLISIPFVFLASWAQSAAGAMKSFAEHGLLQRVAQAAYGLCFYVVETVWPANLYPMYELEANLDPFAPLHILSFVVVVAISIALLVWRRRVPYLTVSWFAYACIVAPVLGFAQSGPQKVADRYTYLPCLPFAVLFGGLILYLSSRWSSRPAFRMRTTLAVATGIVVLILGTLTFRQLDVWRDSVHLWEHSVAIAPRSHISLFNLAKAYEDQGRYDDSIRYLRLALQVRPGAIDPRRNLGILLADKKHEFDAAISEFEILLQRRPDDAEVHYCIGLCHAGRSRHEAALRSFLVAVAVDENYAPAHRALADAYQRLGDHAKANQHRAIARRLGR